MSKALVELIETWRRRAATCLKERDKYPGEDEGWVRLHAKARTWEQAADELERAVAEEQTP